MKADFLSADTFLKEILPAVILPNLGGILGAVIVARDVKIYDKFKKPSWAPPKWAFGPVWTLLYTLMGIASWMVYRSGSGFSGPAQAPLLLYGSQLILNWLWSPLFFKARRPGLALVDIAALWVNIVACLVTFHQVNAVASYLLVPYLAWVSLATALNHNLYQNNFRTKSRRAK